MIQIHTQYTLQDLKEATAKVNRLNQPGVTKGTKWIYVGAVLLLAFLLIVATAFLRGSSSSKGTDTIASQFVVLLAADVFIYGLAGFVLLCILPKHAMQSLTWFGLILGIAVIIRALGSANVPPPIEQPPLPEDTPRWVRIANSGLLFWTLFFVAMWVASFRLTRRRYLQQWNLQQHLHFPVEITLSENEVRFRTHVEDQRYQWAAYCRWLETEHLFILQPSFAVMEMIPKRSFASGEQIEEVRRLIEQRVQNGNPSITGFAVLTPQATSPTPVSSTKSETP